MGWVQGLGEAVWTQQGLGAGSQIGRLVDWFIFSPSDPGNKSQSFVFFF